MKNIKSSIERFKHQGDYFDGDFLHDCIKINESFNYYHKYCHELDNRVDLLIMKTVAMITMFNSNDF